MICCGQFYIVAINHVLTLPNTDTDNNADTDKMGLQPNCICVSVGVSVGVGQCEPLHTILYNPFLPAATKLGQGNIFRNVCQEFCPLGGRVSASVHTGIHPPPWEQTPREQTPREADCSIRSTSGRYASYWNAFLFYCCLCRAV